MPACGYSWDLCSRLYLPGTLRLAFVYAGLSYLSLNVPQWPQKYHTVEWRVTLKMKRLPNVRCRCIDHVRHSFLNLSSSAVNWVGLEKPYKGRFIFVSKRFKRRCRLTQFVVLKNKLSAAPAAWPVFLITTIVLCGVLVSAAVDVSHIDSHLMARGRR